MYYTYIITITEGARHFYVGSTEDLVARLADHNAGRSPHTAKYRPWKLVWYCAYHQRTKAEAFERNL